MTPDPMKEFQARLKQLMIGKSGSWLARASGLSQPKVSRILGGIGEPKLSEIHAIATAFEILPSTLLDPAGSPLPVIPTSSSSMAKTIAEQQSEIDELRVELARLQKSTAPVSSLTDLSPEELELLAAVRERKSRIGSITAFVEGLPVDSKAGEKAQPKAKRK